ncbi:MAG: FIST C-terminal domain-containing protein [Deltaproteobacteria bacterium]|jgi:hypothetical protein|nr:FIST C-terminal domain-containing protein [Deltaproteobacteria bacterium]
MISAQTLEADDGTLAARDVLGQLSDAGPLSRNALGIVHCDNAFVETGACAAVCRALPFPTVGVNTLLHSSERGTIGSTILTVTVLTSPDVRMAAALSEPMEEDVRGPCEALFSDAMSVLRERPAAGLVFGPFLQWCASGELICYALDAASGGLPLFGCLASDYAATARSPRVIYNGAAWASRAALVLLGSEARPRFAVYPVSGRTTIRDKAVVTESEANVVRRVNGMPVLDFLETLGLCRDGQLCSMHIIPIFLERGGGRPPIVRAIHSQTQDGAILLAGNAPAGATLGIGAMDIAHIIEGVRRAASVMNLSGSGCTLLYSCFARGMCLGLNYTMEMEALRRAAGGRSQYLFSYSLGEFCPVLLPDGKFHNEYHNMSLVTMSM